MLLLLSVTFCVAVVAIIVVTTIQAYFSRPSGPLGAQHMSSPAGVARRSDTLAIVMKVPSDGHEVFTPVLNSGRVYRFIFTGICTYTERSGIVEADAVFCTDDYGNFTQRYDGVEI